ncbi:hypothetical protein, partial [Nocardia thailandica]
GVKSRNQISKFGTDIHRHTIEFSKNTRTHIHPILFEGVSVRQLFQLSAQKHPEASSGHVSLVTIDQALIVLPRFPGRC